MGNFRSDSRGGFRNRSSGNRTGGSSFGGRSDGNRSGGSRFGGSGGSRFGGRDGGRDGFRGRDSRRPAEMHEITCDKCGKQCEVPFKPTGDKPVFCSDCFRKNSSPGNDSDSRNQNRTQSGFSSEQLNKINAKLDRIIKILQELEIDNEEDSEESENDEDLDDDEEDSEDEEVEDKSEESNEEDDSEDEEETN